MKISANQADRFVHAPPAEIRAVLVYGPDLGLVRERSNHLIDATIGIKPDVFDKAELASSSISKDAVRLVDEVLAISFSGQRRVVSISDSGDEVVGALSTLLAHEPAQNPLAALVVVSAGNLSPRSKLRRLFETESACAAVPCYADDEAALVRLARETLQEAEITFDQAVLHTTVSLLSSDRQANRRELEKLALFAGPGGELTEQMVAACLGDSAEGSIDDAVMAAADADYVSLIDHLARVWAEGSEPIAVIRNAQRHFQRLHYVQAQTNAGAPMDAALKQLRPPVFWRTAARFRAQAANISPTALETALARLTEAELAAKSTGAPAAIICDRALLSIAQLARPNRQ